MHRPCRTLLVAIAAAATAAAMAQSEGPQRAVLARQAWGNDATAYVALDGKRLALRHALRQPLDSVCASLDTGMELHLGTQGRLRVALQTGLTRQAPAQALAITLVTPF